MATADALWSIAVMVLTGMGLGVMATAYAACRASCRFWRVLGHLSDWLWFVVAAILLVMGLVVADWGQLRLWALVALAIGFAVWMALAQPLALTLLVFVARAVKVMILDWALAPFWWLGQGLSRMSLAIVKRLSTIHGPKRHPPD